MAIAGARYPCPQCGHECLVQLLVTEGLEPKAEREQPIVPAGRMPELSTENRAFQPAGNPADAKVIALLLGALSSLAVVEEHTQATVRAQKQLDVAISYIRDVARSMKRRGCVSQDG